MSRLALFARYDSYQTALDRFSELNSLLMQALAMIKKTFSEHVRKKKKTKAKVSIPNETEKDGERSYSALDETRMKK